MPHVTLQYNTLIYKGTRHIAYHTLIHNTTCQITMTHQFTIPYITLQYHTLIKSATRRINTPHINLQYSTPKYIKLQNKHEFVTPHFRIKLQYIKSQYHTHQFRILPHIKSDRLN